MVYLSSEQPRRGWTGVRASLLLH